MTQTLTTERMAEIAKLAIRLQQISSCAAVTSSGETVLHHTHVDEILSALHDVTAELLANREAQPVAEYGDAYQGAREDLSIWKRRALEAEGKVRHLERVNDHLVKEAQGEHRMGEPVFTAPPAPANAQPVGFDTLADAVKEVTGGIRMEFTPDTYKGHQPVPFMNFTSLSRIVEMFRSAPPAPAVPKEMTKEDAMAFVRERPPFKGSVDCVQATWNACRAAMLAQPVSQGYKLPDNVREALTLALQAMEFMGDTLNNIDAVCTEDVEYVTPAFTAVRELLAAAPASN